MLDAVGILNNFSEKSPIFDCLVPVHATRILYGVETIELCPDFKALKSLELLEFNRLKMGKQQTKDPGVQETASVHGSYTAKSVAGGACEVK